MILYSVDCKTLCTNDQWSVVTIHKTLEEAREVMNRYIKNYRDISMNEGNKYAIRKIDTDSDIIYDYEFSPIIEEVTI